MERFPSSAFGLSVESRSRALALPEFHLVGVPSPSDGWWSGANINAFLIRQKAQPAAPANGEGEKFDEWKKRDEKLMESTYEKELQEALLMSRLEQEKKVDAVGDSDSISKKSPLQVFIDQ